VSARPDLIVVGAGISALASAFWLAEAGLKPLVVASPDIPDLLPQLDLSLALPWNRPRVLTQLEARGVTLMRELIIRLAQETGVDLELGHRDLLMLGAAGESSSSSCPLDSTDISEGPISSFEPQLVQGQERARCLHRRASVRSDRLIRALALALASRGVEILTHQRVKRLEVTGNIVLGVELNNHELLFADATVLAADQASAALLYDSGLEAIAGGSRLAPALQFVPSSTALGCAVIEPSILLAPREEGCLVAMSNLDPSQRAPLRLNELRLQVHRCLPGLGRHDLQRRGVMPVPGTVLKASIGSYPGVRGLWINTGHDALGPLIAPAAAEFLTEQLSGGPAVADLEPTFSRSMQPSC